MDTPSLWERFCRRRINYEDLGFSFDFSRMDYPDDYISSRAPLIDRAYEAMAQLEAGSIANPDEERMVGHYWLRAPERAPEAEMKTEIDNTLASIKQFAGEVHAGEIAAPNKKNFTDLLLVGIGGSALGPQFIAEALGSHEDRMRVHFLDNTDPDGIDKVLEQLRDRLAQVLVLVISKSGGTKETRNGMLEVQATMEVAGLNFEKQAVAVTGDGSQLDQTAVEGGWLARFPMWDWVGGRTSIMSAVGLLPMALQGLDIDRFLAGAAAMDERTRVPETDRNAAMMLALMWHYAGGGRGSKDMVVLPYKDRLMLFSKYLQQLVMESLGKELDLDGQVVNQGIAVYGNKGSTDQHAYVQQLREGILNFFVTFLEVRKSRSGHSIEVDEGVTTGDYLQGFLRGTRSALYEKGRESITISLPQVDAFNVGALIALYERAVGFYASLVNINAYHQPGVEAGKKAAAVVLELKARVEGALAGSVGNELTASEVASQIEADPESVYHLLRHLAANHPEIRREAAGSPDADTFTQSA